MVVFFASQPATSYPMTVDGCETTFSHEIDNNPYFSELKPETKQVFHQVDQYLVRWSLINIRPKILGWILFPFVLPVLIIGTLGFGLEVARSSGSTEEERNGFGPKWGTFRWALSLPWTIYQCVYLWAFPGRQAGPENFKEKDITSEGI